MATVSSRIEPEGSVMERDFTAYRVRRFIEKPRLDKALGFLKRGRYLWNAEIFVWRLSAIREAFMKYDPPLYEVLRETDDQLRRGKMAFKRGLLPRNAGPPIVPCWRRLITF